VIINAFIILKILFLVLNFIECQSEIGEQEKAYEKVEYQVKVIKTNESEFNSNYVQFKILKVNNKINVKYTGLKGFVFIKNANCNQLLSELDLERLEGVKLQITGNFSKIKSISNPGDKSRIPFYLSNKNLGELDFYTIEVTPFKRENSLDYLIKSNHRFLDFRESVHEKIKIQTNMLYKGHSNSLLIAMLLGDKENLEYSIEKGFQNTGISHIIAISGLHIGMLYLLLSLTISMISKNSKVKFFLAFILLISYNFIIGHNVSAIRATSMVLVYIYALAFNRCYNKERSLYFCVILYLLVFPEGVFSGGFLLSYGAVLGLFYIYPVLKKYSVKRSKEIYDLSAGGIILDLALISISVNLMTLPILIYLFNGISLISVIANIFIVPVVMSFYTLGLLTLIISIINYWLALFMAGTVEMISSYIVGLGIMLGNLPFAFVYIKTPQISLILCYYFVVYLIIKKNNSVDIAMELKIFNEKGLK